MSRVLRGTVNSGKTYSGSTYSGTVVSGTSTSGVKESSLVKPSTLVQESTLVQPSTLVSESTLVGPSTLVSESTLVGPSTLVSDSSSATSGQSSSTKSPSSFVSGESSFTSQPSSFVSGESSLGTATKLEEALQEATPEKASLLDLNGNGTIADDLALGGAVALALLGGRKIYKNHKKKKAKIEAERKKAEEASVQSEFAEKTNTKVSKLKDALTTAGIGASAWGVASYTKNPEGFENAIWDIKTDLKNLPDDLKRGIAPFSMTRHYGGEDLIDALDLNQNGTIADEVGAGLALAIGAGLLKKKLKKARKAEADK